MMDDLLKNIENLQKNNESKVFDLNDQLKSYLETEPNFNCCIKPTHGILIQRQFFYFFAFRTFCCTQCVRNHNAPDRKINFSDIFLCLYIKSCITDTKIRILSLAVSEQQIVKLGSLYWFTLQFGACKQANKVLGYETGIASGQIQVNSLGLVFFKRQSHVKKFDWSSISYSNSSRYLLNHLTLLRSIKIATIV